MFYGMQTCYVYCCMCQENGCIYDVIHNNYSLKFWWVSVSVETSFPFFQGVTKNYGRVTSNATISKYTHIHTNTHTLCWSRLVTWFDCFALRELFPAMYAAFAHTIFETRLTVSHRPKLWCVLVILNAPTSNLVSLRDALVARLVHMTSI